jgi:hypothetical protein
MSQPLCIQYKNVWYPDINWGKRKETSFLIQTPLANLSRFMRHIDGVYRQKFNNKHKLDG